MLYLAFEVEMLFKYPWTLVVSMVGAMAVGRGKGHAVSFADVRLPVVALPDLVTGHERRPG